jgi:hypothetical protein
MPIVINELVAEVQPEPNPAQTAGTEPRPPDGRPGETLLDLLTVTREREARLAID